jgi:hypothetical protein
MPCSARHWSHFLSAIYKEKVSMLNSLKGRKIHTRNIQISTYETDTEKLIVEGILKDNLLISHFDTSGEKHLPNTVHHMVVRILIGTTSFKIVDIEVEMPVFPHKDCGETKKSLDKIIGMRIAPGFTEKVKNMLGGTNSCSHLKTLVLSMASAAVQGFWVHRTKEPKTDDSTPDLMNSYVIDTCWVWRKDGPLAIQKMENAKR